MTTSRILHHLRGIAVVALILGGTSACSADSDIDTFTSCLDDAGVTYSIDDGTVVVTQYAGDGSAEMRAASQACHDLVDDK